MTDPATPRFDQLARSRVARPGRTGIRHPRYRPKPAALPSPGRITELPESARSDMSFQLYLSFLAAALVLVYAPGPVNLLTMSHALRAG